jgi:hypothetical protein
MSGSDSSGFGFFFIFYALDVLCGPGSSENLRFLVYVREAILFHGRDGVRPHPDD